MTELITLRDELKLKVCNIKSYVFNSYSHIFTVGRNEQVV